MPLKDQAGFDRLLATASAADKGEGLIEITDLSDAEYLNRLLYAPAPIEKPFEWHHCSDVEQMETFFYSRLPMIRSAARECGYAIGLHGSVRRDLDLMAMPWIEEPKPRDYLAREIQYAACGLRQDQFRWEAKPRGRFAVSLPICWTDWSYSTPNLGHIDLSVMEPAP